MLYVVGRGVGWVSFGKLFYRWIMVRIQLSQESLYSGLADLSSVEVNMLVALLISIVVSGVLIDMRRLVLPRRHKFWKMRVEHESRVT